ncbi:ribonuclease III [Oricola sp.]|uniref:ribonuclease III n=1 Tax=Oricola sp. TaxID=1979950 RepID=UPI0025FF22CD|nr:ribonuclease III [Oricola sp.]MCI5077416.1 ribonuclease III [Oricola sp.]
MTKADARARVSSDMLQRLEETTGHRFENRERLDRALTHASARGRTGRDYERLEFLGDRVLGLCVAEMLFAEFKDANEGELSVRLNQLVNADALAAVADELSLGDFIRAGSDVRQLRDSHRKNLRADVVESLIATIYLEGGLDAVRPFIRRYWKDRAVDAETARRDAKTELQEWAHRAHAATPVYKVLERTGPDHDPMFTVSVTVGALAPESAEGRSKRIAEQAAAARMLVREKVRDND